MLRNAREIKDTGNKDSSRIIFSTVLYCFDKGDILKFLLVI